ncbi:unnamed protein product, partial [Closterium sp. Naga37s-1]
MSTSSTSPSCHLDSRFFLSPSPVSVSASSVATPLLLSPPSPPPPPNPSSPLSLPPHTADISFRFSPLFPLAFISLSPLPLPGSLVVSHRIFQAYDAAISFLSSLLHVNSSCASLPASSRPSLTWTRPTTPTPAALIPHTTSSSPDPTPSQTPHSSQPSRLGARGRAASGGTSGSLSSKGSLGARCHSRVRRAATLPSSARSVCSPSRSSCTLSRRPRCNPISSGTSIPPSETFP